MIIGICILKTVDHPPVVVEVVGPVEGQEGFALDTRIIYDRVLGILQKPADRNLGRTIADCGNTRAVHERIVLVLDVQVELEAVGGTPSQGRRDEEVFLIHEIPEGMVAAIGNVHTAQQPHSLQFLLEHKSSSSVLGMNRKWFTCQHIH